MPKFPRFTSGTFGRLDFATMNDLFERVEQLEAALQRQQTTRQRMSEIVLCYCTEIVSTVGGCVKAKWVEASPKQDSPCESAEDANLSRSSSGQLGTDQYPLYGKNLVVGKVYLAHPSYLPDGSLIYRQIETGAAGPEWYPAEILGAQSLGQSTDGIVYRWKYAFREMYLADDENAPGFRLEFLPVFGGRTSVVGANIYASPAYNTLERDGYIGLGGTAPNIEETPTAIKNGRIVLIKDAGDRIFSAGPATDVRCL
jgi:hypothetical protein